MSGRSVFPLETSHWNDPDHLGAFYLHGQTGRFTDWLFGRMESTVQDCKFCPGNVFTICTNQFLWPKNGGKGLKLVSKMALKKWNSTFCWEQSVRKRQDYLFWCSIAPWNFPLDRHENSCSFTSRPEFPEPVGTKRMLMDSTRHVAFTFQPDWTGFL